MSKDDISEWYSWVCPKCGASGGAHTRQDAEMAAAIHAAVCEDKKK